MKTTVDIADDLLSRAKAVAARDKTTLRALIERGLRVVLEERRRSKPFKLRDASVGGQRLQPGIRIGAWSEITSLIYEGRGG
jgi:hypothetical protein